MALTLCVGTIKILFFQKIGFFGIATGIGQLRLWNNVFIFKTKVL